MKNFVFNLTYWQGQKIIRMTGFRVQIETVSDTAFPNINQLNWRQKAIHIKISTVQQFHPRLRIYVQKKVMDVFRDLTIMQKLETMGDL